MGLKSYAYWLTGSSAILSDALESIINVVASAFALWSVLLSAKPPDESHPYGHGKIEFFSAGFEGALIILAAAGIFQQGLKQILESARASVTKRLVYSGGCRIGESCIGAGFDPHRQEDQIAGASCRRQTYFD